MKSPNWDLAACSLSNCNMLLYHETLRCIASIHSYVVNEGKFDTSDVNICMKKTLGVGLWGIAASKKSFAHLIWCLRT